MQRSPSSPRLWLRLGLWVAFVGLFAWLLYKNWQVLLASFHLIRTVELGILYVALVLLVGTFVAAAMAYRFLALHRLAFGQLVVVELAAAFVNRLVPAGLGTLGVHGMYLYRHRHTGAEATAVISINNLLGMLVHFGLLGIVVVCWPIGLHFHVAFGIMELVVALLIAVVGYVLVASGRLRRPIVSFLHNLHTSLRRYRRDTSKLARASGALLALTMLNVTLLYLAMRGFGVHLSVPTLFVIYSLGVLGGTASPTPGGLAGVEASLAGGFIAAGITAPIAIAIALLFRIVTYWVPILPGTMAFLVARQKHYF